jgi:hypothetical protein
MPENSEDSYNYPNADPNAMTRSFDAFKPAPPMPPGPGGLGGGQYPADPPYFAYPPDPGPITAIPVRHSRARSAAVIAAVVVVVCGIGAGAYAALSSSSSNQPAAASATSPAAGTATGGHKHGKVQTARVTIISFNGQTLTGTTASGATVLVNITSETKYGTDAHPLNSSSLVAGDVVIVRGDRVSEGTYNATEIAIAPTTAPSGGAVSVTPTPTGSSA